MASKPAVDVRLLINVLLLLLVFIVLFNLFTTSSIRSQLEEREFLKKLANAPAKVELTVIDPGCEECLDIAQVVDAIKGANVEVTAEKTVSREEGAELIKKYNITRLPSVLVHGELDKAKLPLPRVDDAAVFNDIPAPYIDVLGNLAGLVDITVITDNDCDNCFDMTLFTGQVEQIAKVKNVKSLQYTDPEAEQLLDQYGLTAIPAIILSKEVEEYAVIAEQWANYGEVIGGQYVMTRPIPPFRNLTSGEVTGAISITYIDDKSCDECYNVSLHGDFLEQMGVLIVKEKTVDVSEASTLLEKYNIELVPTVIVSKDASVYPSFIELYNQLGSEEDDAYVFRDVDRINGAIYKNLTSGEILHSEAGE